MIEALETVAAAFLLMALMGIFLGAVAYFCLQWSEKRDRIVDIRAHDEYPKPPVRGGAAPRMGRP
jgi:hypothetical protein